MAIADAVIALDLPFLFSLCF